MSLRITTLVLLAMAAGLATWRSARAVRAGPRAWLQIPAALLLYFVLFPPQVKMRGEDLSIITPEPSPRERRSAPRGQLAVALPGALAPAGVETVPDLATALRRYPQVRKLTVLGSGLPPRDWPAAAGLALDFQPAPEKNLVELQAPDTVLLGHEWTLRGRAQKPAVRVELRDPSGAVADASTLDDRGRFSLSAVARGQGAVRFELRVFDAQQALVESASVPLVIGEGQSLAIVARAGAANPEFKYWRRWAIDSGLQLQSAAELTEGIAMRSGDARLTPAVLAASDLVVIDARGWATLDASEKSALHGAVEDGLGLLLRADAPVDAAVLEDWKAFGYVVSPAAIRTPTIDARTGLRSRTLFATAPLQIEPSGSVELLQADDGAGLAWWRPQGHGRVGMWLLTDSYKLVLLGEAARYASLWSDVVDQLARARPAAPAPPNIPQPLWVDERAVICAFAGPSHVLAPGQKSTTLLQDSSGCAAYWPPVSGWQTLETAEGQWPFYVRAQDDGPGLRFARDRAVTAGMVRDLPAAQAAATQASTVSRWPFFAAWILIVGAIWWTERAALRRPRAVTTV